MIQLTPGLYVHPYVPQGRLYKIATWFLDIEGLAGSDWAWAVNPHDWERIPGPDRERLLDTWTHESAKAGLAQLEDWLGCDH